MAFRFTDDLTAHYYTYGYTVFRRVIPGSLIEDLRTCTDQAREIARDRFGQQVQRLPHVWSYDLDLTALRAFAELPELTDAISRVLSPRHFHGIPKDVLFEPAERPYTLAWHRDWMEATDIRSFWEPKLGDMLFFNQINAPLYDDASLWVAPGSQDRAELPSERRAVHPSGPRSGGVIGLTEARAFAALTGRSDQLEDQEALTHLQAIEQLSNAEREHRGLEYCENMPGATCLALNAGDVAIYRNTLWHSGTYVPYKKRATLHGFIDTPEFALWRQQVRTSRSSASAETPEDVNALREVGADNARKLEVLMAVQQ